MTLLIESRADLTLVNAARVAWSGEQVRLGERALDRMAACRKAFERLLEDPSTVIYGVTSGYGQNADQRLSAEERRRQAARPPLAPMTALGEGLPQRIVRGILFARLANFMEGHAAVSPAVALAVAELLSQESLPTVPAEAALSPGEILPLSHLFAPLAARLDLKEKDSLALVNGSPVASALLADAALAADRRLELLLSVFALAWDAFKAPLGHLDPALDALWGDPAESAVLKALRRRLEGAEQGARRPYQAPVSFRILPRVAGQAARAVEQARALAAIALPAVTDNPVFLPPDEANPNGRVISTGGFHSGAAYPALDALAAAWADLALLVDRQTTKLLDGRVSLLPDQLSTGKGGYLGCLGFTALSLAEGAREAAQRTFLPASEGGGFGQNDVAVPTVSAWQKEERAARALERGLAVLAVISSQAFHVTKRRPPPALQELLSEVRREVPPVLDPRPLGPEVESLAARFAEKVFAPPPLVELP